jgi:hypothetical protein
MATVSLIDPYSQQAEQIARRQRMAQALQERGSQVLEMPTMPGVLISPYAGLAKVLESGIGAYQEKKAQDDLNKFQTDYRNKYNTQFENLAKAISAPAVPGVEGQEAVAPQEAVTEPIYGTMPDPTYGGFDVGLQTQDPSNVIGQKEINPRVPGREAIAPKAAIPAGYISPETLKGIDIPEVKQLAMARYLAQFEPKDIKLGQGDTLYRQVGSGPLVEQAVGKTAAKSNIGNVNPSDYTPESIAKFALSSNYKDLVLKPAKTDKADRTIANVNPDSYTPASVAAFALSNNYADLVLKPEKAKDNKNIGNVNPNDFTPASIEKFVASGKYSDLVPVKKASEGGAGGDKVPTGSISVIDPTDPAGKRVILVTQARAIKESLTPASSTKESAATEGERKAATLLQRLQFSESQLTQALLNDPNAAKPGVFSSAVAKLSTPLANSLTPEARQRVQSAQLDILDAALTLGTGAAYTREQLEGYREAYFPQLFDKPNQIKDKQARLENVINAAKIAAGRAAQLIPAAPAAAVGGSSAMSAADAIINKGRR